jgi:hypothetical protein
MLPAMKLTTLLFMLSPMVVTAQDAEPASPTVGTQTTTAPSNAAGNYANPELHLSFSYPQELLPQDVRAVAERGHIAFYGSQPETDPDHIKSEACNKPLLSVSKASDPKKSRIGIRSDKKTIYLKPDPGGSISLFEIEKSCIPSKDLKKMENTLAGIAIQTTKIPGLAPIDRPVWYEIQGHRVHFAAAYGQPISKDMKTLGSDSQIIAGLAVEVNDHILFWMLQANDIDFFNRLLDSKVDFGSGTPQALSPTHMH